MTGVRGKGLLRLALLPLQLLIAFWQSARAIFAHRPDVVLGMGGYVSFPGGMMASLLNRPLAIHEQNSIAGLANRVLARVADRVLAGFPGAFGASTAIIWSGNPVRSEIAALAVPAQRYRSRTGPLRLTVIGGSLGAQALNAAVPQALALLPEHARPRVTHQSGARHLAEVEANYQRAGVSATLLPFIADMASHDAESDLIICRAGAATIAEIAAAGIASVLVPLPHAADTRRHRSRIAPQRSRSSSRQRRITAQFHTRDFARDGAEGARGRRGNSDRSCRVHGLAAADESTLYFVIDRHGRKQGRHAW